MTSMQKVKVRGQRSRSQRSKPNLAVAGPFEFTYGDEMMHKAWCCLEEVPYYFSRSSVKFQGHTAKKIVDFHPSWAFPDCNSSLNSPMAMKWYTELQWSSVGEKPYCFSRSSIKFQGHTGKKLPILTRIERFRTVSQVWLHRWIWNDVLSLMS